MIADEEFNKIVNTACLCLILKSQIRHECDNAFLFLGLAELCGGIISFTYNDKWKAGRLELPVIVTDTFPLRAIELSDAEQRQFFIDREEIRVADEYAIAEKRLNAHKELEAERDVTKLKELMIKYPDELKKILGEATCPAT